ncbi:unnamed protein product [Ceratitis capitata]|uniref:(Mediterranean fruit fly) hypothetical protein n=1 Tax=Ceratitis capitata TaxID=7213 RepID=A0A811UIE5_CERCA|nr:unnamed protein product [Ceratitis capitata]
MKTSPCHPVPNRVTHSKNTHLGIQKPFSPNKISKNSQKPKSRTKCAKTTPLTTTKTTTDVAIIKDITAQANRWQIEAAS